MRLENLLIVQKNIFQNPNSIPVVSVGKYKNYSSNNTDFKSFDGYTITVVTRKQDTLKIKLPLSTSEVITKITTSLACDKNVYVCFPDIKFKAYALKADNGNIVSGVSAKADDVTIVSINDDSADIIDI